MRRFLLFISVTALVLSSATFATPVEAQEASADDEEARATFQAARLAYENGRYRDAYGLFARAYSLSGRTILLYNMGQSADRARMDTESIDAFDRYLASDEVDETLRPEIEQRLQAMQDAQAREEARVIEEPDVLAEPETVAEPEVLVPSPEETALAAQPDPLIARDEPDEGKSTTKWVVIALVAVAVVAGGVTAALLLRDPGMEPVVPPNTGVIVEALR